MSADNGNDLHEYCLDVARRAKAASEELAQVTGAQKNQWLRTSAKLLVERSVALAEANHLDLAAAPGYGLTPAEVDRLKLTPERIDAIAHALEEVAMLPDPIGEVTWSSVRPSGLVVHRVRVPLGVIFFIYESRPNVTADAAALCIKSGNAVILRGGKEAVHSNTAIVEILTEAAADAGLPGDAVQLVATPDRAAISHFLRMPEYINVTIPRGGEGLIRRVSEEARMPVIKHYTGNCHVYLDKAADPDMAEQIVINAKCQRMGVCNAAESLVVHSAVAASLLPRIAKALLDRGVEIRGDERTCALVHGAKPATEADWSAEYLGPVISVKVVDSLDEAIRHINRYGSQHTDSIVTGDLRAAREFTARVDSSAVIVNASTRLNDGGVFGLGAEIGISTDKFHARGPCGLNELTSYKYVVYGEGHLRQ
ncbi:MAG: glutamate-5-semialdehyde dehydrogenase [Thermoguttaceae bacterium]|jgi:glutamate-5-semialdehyde dehydrogenase|nr:glutamate-5-semialdehyde dehydrogenase [Thermoguttaceae bacterium]